MEKEFQKDIRPILDCFDKIRIILKNEPIELPRIVVIGDQSSGKSSVLESITRVQLPRGQNCVTRCPIVIQLRNVNDELKEGATVSIQGNKEIDSEEEIKINQIETLAKFTKELIDKANIEITETPINLYLKKTNVPDITLIDLPGMTYKNKNHKNLEDSVRKLIRKYTQESETLILLIISAETDFTTSETYSLARENENYKERTMAIITKIDRAENGIGNRLQFHELELEFEPAIVRNRTQEELYKNLSFEECREIEKDFITSHKELSSIKNIIKGTES